MITTEFRNPDGSLMYNVKRMTNEERRIYNAWREIKSRCNCKTCRVYADYGGRGIKLSQEFTVSLEAFAECLGPRPHPNDSIDRIDNDKGYERGNLRWASKYIQMRNRRVTIWIEYKGERLCLEDWAAKSGIHKLTLYTRWRKGLRGDELFYTSPNRGREGIYVEIEGVTKHLTDWSKHSGVAYPALISRYNAGWRGKDLLKPVRYMTPRKGKIVKDEAGTSEIAI